MVLRRVRALFALLLLALAASLSLALPAAAHENHQAEQIAPEERAGNALTNAMNPTVMPGMMREHSAGMEAETPKTWPARLLSWAGRMHPFAVHFPIALIPISWLALVIARRRGDTVDLIRAFIIVAGVAAVGAAALGWINAGFALTDRNPILAVHRWTGTVLAIVGAVIALWAWRKASSVNSRAMVWTLGVVTFVLLAQGWLGGAITHGVRHMMM